MSDNFLLVTVADERTWGQREKILFLGDWCLPYSKEKELNGVDYVIAEPYGTELSIKDGDYGKTKEIIETALNLLIPKLNQVHRKEYGERQWRIILGHWLRRYVEVCINRFNSVENCLKKYEVKQSILFQADDLYLASETSLQFVYSCNEDIWNNCFYGKIFEYLNRFGYDINLKFINLKSYRAKSKNIKICNLKSKLKNVFNFLNAKIKNKKEIFLYNIYVAKLEFLFLSLKLKQWPKFYTPLSYEKNNFDRELRQKLKIQIVDFELSSVENFAIEHLFDFLPKCFLEDFSSIEMSINGSVWPNNPSSIITANAFDYDEAFKIYTASKTMEKISYMVLQHGNNYGTYRFNIPTVEELTSDKFFTWGWKDNLIQHIPTFVIKNNLKKTKRINPDRLLLIHFPLPHKIYTWDIYTEFRSYFEEQKDFISSLNQDLRKSLRIRLHPEYKIRDWNELDRFRDFSKDLQFDNPKHSLNKSIRQSKLVIFSYDSTGILETLSANIPMMAFWQNNYDHLRVKALPYYEELRKVGIIHLSVESIVNQIHAVWENVDEWWQQEELQSARIRFCNQFARSESKRIDKLAEFILS
jgi:putative transferase (TIGR04331 family)